MQSNRSFENWETALSLYTLEIPSWEFFIEYTKQTKLYNFENLFRKISPYFWDRDSLKGVPNIPSRQSITIVEYFELISAKNYLKILIILNKTDFFNFFNNLQLYLECNYGAVIFFLTFVKFW